MPDPLILAAAVWTSFAAVGLLAAILLRLRGTMSPREQRVTVDFHVNLSAFAEGCAALAKALREIGRRRE